MNRSSVGVPPRPCTNRTPTRPPSKSWLRSGNSSLSFLSFISTRLLCVFCCLLRHAFRAIFPSAFALRARPAPLALQPSFVTGPQRALFYCGKIISPCLRDRTVRLAACNPKSCYGFRAPMTRRQRPNGCCGALLLADTVKDAIEQLEAQVHFRFADVQARRQRHHVFVVAADIEHETVALAVHLDLSLQALVHHAVDDRLGGRETVVRLADLHAQCHAEAIDVADDWVAALELLQTLQQVGALLHH